MSSDHPRPEFDGTDDQASSERPAVDDPFGLGGDSSDDSGTDQDDGVSLSVLAALDDLVGRFGSAEGALSGLMADDEVRGLVDQMGLTDMVSEFLPADDDSDGPSIPPIVDVAFLDTHPEARIVDSRLYLDGRDAEEEYRRGHLPGAVFIDVDTELSGRPGPGVGRHPLPDPESFAAVMSRAGIDAYSTVVIYDDAAGFGAGRLVWMLRSLGVDAALLDGGIEQWGGELDTETAEVEAGDFPVVPWPDWALADLDEVKELAAQDEDGVVVLDARAAERYAGGGASLDPVAGHVPGALSAPFAGNLDENGLFLDPEQLRARYEALGIGDETDVVVYCGSGVSAAHDLLALERAGFEARLFPGSWSQWATVPGLPVATGQTPRGEVTTPEA